MILQRAILFIIFALSFTNVILGQKVIDFNTYFKTSIISQDRLDTSKSIAPSFKSPLIEEIEFRSETKDFDISKQRYQIRFSPTGSKIQNIEEALYQELVNEYQLRASDIKYDKIKQYYESYLSLYFSLKRFKIFKVLLPLYDDLITSASKPDSDGTVDIPQVIELKQEKSGIAYKKSLLEEYLREAGIDATKDSLSLVSYISAKNLIERYDNDNATYNGLPIDLSQLRQIELEYDKEMLEKNKIFKFLQLGYEGPHTNLLDERFNLRVALRLPFTGKDSYKLAEANVERLIQKDQIERKKRAAKLDVIESKQLVSIAGKQLSEEKTLNLLLDSHLDDLDRISPNSLKELNKIIRLKIDFWERKLDLIDFEINYYHAYLDFLDETNALKQRPLVNFFSDSFHHF